MINHQDFSFQTFTEAIPLMAFVADQKGNIIYYNQRWYDYINGLQGTEGWGWKDSNIHHPDDLQQTIERWNNCLQTGLPYEVEYRLRRFDGEYRWHLGRANPVNDADGKIVMWLGTNTDIHDHKLAVESLNRNKKLQEDLIYILAHDLRNPINNLNMIMDLIKSTNSSTDQDELMQKAKFLLQKQESILDEVVEIIKIQSTNEVKIENVNLKKVAEAILREHEQIIKESGAVFNINFDQVPEINYVQGFLESILKNLISNALKYRNKNRTLIIDVSCVKCGDYLQLTVKDNGIGIDLEEHKHKLFKPFARFTHQAGGIGLGLYIVKNLIERNGGYVEVESQLGTGTTFHCYLRS